MLFYKSKLSSLCLAVVLVISTFQVFSAPVEIAEYDFNNDLTSNVVSAPDLVYLDAMNPPIYSNDTVFGESQTVLNFPSGIGLSLDVSSLIGSGDTEYSIAMIVELETTVSYKKLIDVKNLTSDRGLYNLSGSLRFYSENYIITNIISQDQYYLIFLTRDSSGLAQGYVNGQLAFSFDDSMDNITLPSMDYLLHFVRDDNASGNGENSSGSLAKIVIFDDALTALEVIRYQYGIFFNGFE